MGNASYRQTTANPNMDQDLKTFMQADLPRFVSQDKIGHGKFMKTFVMRAESTQLVVKVYMKLAEEDLQQAAFNLTTIWKILSPTKFPSLMPYQMWIRSTARTKTPTSPVYLIRQYFNTNLFDRLSTRPFLNDLEKNWIIFQLLKSLEICHEHRIIHGDIKPENIMCTTSNWIVLTDFAPYKPLYIPDDDPTDFQFYFDAMARHKCYIAPERFRRKDMMVKSKAGNLTSNANIIGNPVLPQSRLRSRGSVQTLVTETNFFPSMDVFSLGCVMAEVLLDGTPLFDLPSMLQYLSSSAEGLGGNLSSGSFSRTREEDEYLAGTSPSPLPKSETDESPAKQVLSRIKDPLMRAVIVDMTQKDPEKRLSASDYLNILSGTVDKFHDSYGYVSSSIPSSYEARSSSLSLDGGSAFTAAKSFRDVGSEKVSSPFPAYFDNCIYPLYMKLHWNGITPDDRIIIICETYDHIMEKITGDTDKEGTLFFRLSVENNHRLLSSALTVDMKNQSTLLLPMLTPNYSARATESGDKRRDSSKATLQRARHGIKSDSSGHGEEKLVEEIREVHDRIEGLSEESENGGTKGCKYSSELWKMQAIQRLFTHENSQDFFQAVWTVNRERCSFEGLVLVIDLLCSNYRHLKYLTSRITCLMMLGRVGRGCTDSVILQRIVPLLLVALEDPYSLVKITALRILTALTSIVEEFDPIEVNFFPQYIFPNLGRIARDNELIVRIAFAECMGTLALTAKHFLDRGHSIFLHKAMVEAAAGNLDVNKVTIEFPYDQKLELLKDQVARWIRDIVVDPSTISAMYKSQRSAASGTNLSLSSDSAIKKVILRHIMELCAFFGQESTMEKLLTQLLTFPNDQDWELRCAFCSRIPTVAAFLGATVTSEYIVPCLENTIYDVEEKVAMSTVQAINALIQMRLISKYLVVDFIQKCKALLIHSSKALRTAVQELFVSACASVGEITTAVAILPEIAPILRHPLSPSLLTRNSLNLAVVSPLSGEKLRSALLSRLKAQAGSSNINLSELLYSAISPVDLDEGLAKGDLDSADGSRARESTTDEEKVHFISSYLVSSAREIFNKSLRWRAVTRSSSAGKASVNSFPALQYTTSGQLASPSPSSKLGVAFHSQRISDSVALNPLMWTSLPSLENNVFCFQIPNMKSASYLLEDWRRQSIFLDFDELRNQQKIRYFFMGSAALTRGLDSAQRSLVLNSGDANTVMEDAFTAGNILSGVSAAGSSGTANLLPAMNSPSVAKVATAQASSADLLNPATASASAMMTIYANSSFRFSNSFGTNSISLLRRLKAMNIPPLPVDLGSLLMTSEDRSDGSEGSAAIDTGSQKSWKPKEGILLLTLREHKSAVNRLVVSPDQSYFASASSDRTVRVWQTRQLDRLNCPKSCAVYRCHEGPVTDAVVIDGTHSIASSSRDGSVHVWRVDMQSSQKSVVDISSSASEPLVLLPRSTAMVSGTSVVRTIDSAEGEVLSVQHFNSDIASVVTYATQKGGVHGWDLRMPQEAFRFTARPELGFITSMTVAPDKNWLCLGTSKGYLSLWDIRYNLLTQAWKHSSNSAIHRIACGRAIRSSSPNLSGLPPTEGAYLFVASGENEAAVFGIPEGGECLKCFRALPLDDNKAPIASLPSLEEVYLPRNSSLLSSTFSAANLLPSYSHSVNAMLGRISPTNMSYLITAGSDRHIRFWDFRSPEACYSVAGLEATQLKSIYRRVDEKNSGRLFVCYTPTVPAPDKILQSHLPSREGRGLTVPSSNFKDAILDLKDVDYPMKFLLASSRDGEIKVWR